MRWHYCDSQDCAVVYLDADGQTVEMSELSVDVREREAESQQEHGPTSDPR